MWSQINKGIRLWKYYGTRGLAEKVWEKVFIDRRRFRSGLLRTVPDFTSHTQITARKKGLYIWYLIHFFYPEHTGGTERFVYNLAKQQQKYGNTVRIFVLSQKSKGLFSYRIGEILFREGEYDGLPVTEFRFERTPLGLFYKKLEENPALTAFAQFYIEGNAPDLVHCAYPQPYAGFLAACRNAGLPYMVTLTDFNIFCHYATMVDRQGQFCAGCRKGLRCGERCPIKAVPQPTVRYMNALGLLNGAYAVTVPSEFVANIMRREFPHIHPIVIAHGIDSSFRQKQARKETKRFAYAGTLSELKGVHLLIESFQRLEGEYSLSIYGSGTGPYVRRLYKLAAADSRIHMMGAVPPARMREVYLDHDCIVIPSIWYETYNFVLREALACGCLVVASRMGAMPEAVEEGGNGFLFQSGDVNALAHALERAASFNWELYCQARFPTPADEGASYQKLYLQLGMRNEQSVE